MSRPRCTTAERRARLVARHHLDGDALDATSVAASLLAVHSSDPLTPHLAVQARTHADGPHDLDDALYDARTLWRLHAMRRTLYVVTVDDAPVVQAAAARDVARSERRRLERWVAAAGHPADTGAWLRAVERRTLAALDDGEERSTQQITELAPELATRITVGSGRWTSEVPLGTRLLSQLALEGSLVRTRPAGSWRSSQYRWARPGAWFGSQPRTLEADDARAQLLLRYLGAYGPVTLTDLRWWTGWTAAATRSALTAAGAVEVELDDGATGYVAAGDIDFGAAAARHAPSVALLPGLDPTPMGWKQRDWFLGPHAMSTFDRNGNVGPTIWVDGRIVGGWAQLPDGEVVTRLLEQVGGRAVEAIAERAAALTRWLDGDVVTPRFRTPLERELVAG